MDLHDYLYSSHLLLNYIIIHGTHILSDSDYGKIKLQSKFWMFAKPLPCCMPIAGWSAGLHTPSMLVWSGDGGSAVKINGQFDFEFY